MNKLLPILLVVVLGGCAAIPTQIVIPDMYMKVKNYPELDKITTSSIGDTLVNHTYRNVSEGVSIMEDILFSYAGGDFRFYKGNYLRYSNYDGKKCYGPIPCEVIDILGMTNKLGFFGQFCPEGKN